ncbi:MAG: BrnT family toxin [Alphaproteobacteria bacterium]
MIVLERIVGFEWDDGNRRKSSDKHDVGQAEVEQVFLNEPLLLVEDTKHSGTEVRSHALGRSDAGRLLHVTFTIREDGTRIRVISARDMHRKERARYGEEA